jgi:predicted CopG family antitoxin
MGTKQIRVSEDLYARIQSENRKGETLGETLERLLDDYPLEEFAADAAPAADAWDTSELEADLEESDRRNREELDEQLP